MNNKHGFILVEAIAAVVVVSVCLTLIAQTLLTNFNAGTRFQENTRALLAMENRVGLLYASNGAADQMLSGPQLLEEPYKRLSVNAQTTDITDNLKMVALTIDWPGLRRRHNLDVITVIYTPNQVKTQSYLP